MPELSRRIVRDIAGPGQLGGGVSMRRGLYPAATGAAHRVGEYGVRRGPSPVAPPPRVWEYGILRGMSPVPPTRNRVLYPSNGKENIPPPNENGSAHRRSRLKRRSPLPAWYPRTPLRDITVIVNAMQRRRIRLRAARRQRNQDTEASPLDASPTTPVPLEQSVTEVISPDQPDVPLELCVTDDLPGHVLMIPEQTVTADLSPSEALLSYVSGATPSLCSDVCASPSTESKPLTSSASRCLTSVDTPLAEKEMKLWQSIDEIEKVVMEKLKNTPKNTGKISKRSTLMSMR